MQSHCNEFYKALNVYKYSNGIQVILLPRAGAKNVVIEIVVDVGQRDFSCDRSQTAHVLEHIAFTDTKNLSADKIKSNIEFHGGEMNAYTELEQTLYYIQIHSDYLNIAVSHLFKMLHESVLSEETLFKAKSAVHAEVGTSNNTLRTLAMDKRPVIDRAIAKLYPNSGYGCDEGESPANVRLSDIKRAYSNYYRASNMHLIVVGDFDKHQLFTLLEDTFEKLPLLPRREPFVKPAFAESTEDVVNYLTPLSSGALVGFALRTDGYLSKDSVALELIRLHLNQRLFEQARLKLALGYTPRVEYQTGPEIGHFVAKTRTNYQWVEKVKTVFESERLKLAAEGLTQSEFDNLQKRHLLTLESRPMRNKDVAYEISQYRHWVASKGLMRDLVAETSALTLEDVNGVIDKYFNQPVVYGIERPATFWVAFARVVGVVIVSGIVVLPFMFLLRKARSFKKTI